MTPSELRIIDASLNRAGEGLRVLEDIARLMLNDDFLTRRLKDLRHDFSKGGLSFHQRLLHARDSEGDVGVDVLAEGQGKPKDLPSIVIANSRRAQESLRTLEEMSKLPDTPPELDSEKFKHARFTLYAIEKELLFKLQRKVKIKRLAGLHVILDTGILKEQDYMKLAVRAIKGGAVAIQLHDDATPKKDLLTIAKKLKEVCARNNVLFIIHSHLDVALAVEANGLHLEPDDLPVSIARKLLPTDKIIGCAVADVEQAVNAQEDGADYISAGLKLLRQLRKSITIPLVAVGGITKTNVDKIIAGGAGAVAMVLTTPSENIEKEIRQIAKRIEAKK